MKFCKLYGNIKYNWFLKFVVFYCNILLYLFMSIKIILFYVLYSCWRWLCRDDKLFCMLDILELFKWVSEFIRVLLYVEKYNFFEKEKL